MRISDWSSDVCSSDLASRHARSGSKPLTLGQLAATAHLRLSSPGVPPFLASQESRIAPSFASLRDLRAAAPSPCCPPMRIEAALVRLEPTEGEHNEQDRQVHKDGLRRI